MKVFSYPRKIDDWRRKTGGMSLEERGVYSELIDWYYSTGAELPHDIESLCRMVGATKRSERETVKRVIGNPDLFSVNGTFLVQKMCDETLSLIEGKSKAASRSAEHRWNKNKHIADANALRPESVGNANYKPQTINHKKRDIDSPGLFESFWKSFPKQRAGSKEYALIAYRKALTRTTEEELNAAVIRYARSDEVARGFAKGCAAWLNDDRWSHDYSGASAAGSNGQKPNGNPAGGRQQPKSRAEITAEFISELPESERNQP